MAHLWVSRQKPKMTIFSHFCRTFSMCHLSALRLKIFRPTSTYDPKLNPQSIFQYNSKTSRRYVTSKLFISQGQYLMPPIWPGHKWFCKWINRRNRDVCSKSLFQLLTAWHWILKESFQPFFNGRALFRNFCIWITAKPYLDFFLWSDDFELFWKLCSNEDWESNEQLATCFK